MGFMNSKLFHYVALLFIAIVCWWGFTAYIQSIADKETGKELSIKPPACDSTRKTLVVTLHGMGGHNERMQKAVNIIREKVENSNILELKYKSGKLSNSDPYEITRSVDIEIERHFMDCAAQLAGYDNIILVGYSAGALITRSAYISGLRDSYENSNVAPVTEREWTRHVSRIVLIAGMNRGWSLDRETKGMSWISRQFSKGLVMLANYSGVSRFILSLEQGSPFIADLRINWMRAALARMPQNSFPLVAQLLGGSDEFVTREDEKDLSVSRGFVYIDAGDVNHRSILDKLDGNSTAAKAFNEAISLTDDELINLHAHKVKTYPEYKGLDRILFVRHGIRDDNEWGAELSQKLCKKASEVGEECITPGLVPKSDKTIRVDVGSYGYFGMLPFLFESIRSDKVKKFVDDYIELLAKAGKPDIEVNFLGHSNGTYLLASALEKYSAIKVKRVVFANSVVPRFFAWSKFQGGQVSGPMMNYIGSEDIVVAVFPRLFELHPGLGDLGSAGFKGFTDGVVADQKVVLNGGHGAGIARANWDNLSNFFFPDAQAASPIAASTTGDEKSILSALSNFLWKIPYIGWLLVVVFILGAGIGIYKLLGFYNPPVITSRYWALARGLISFTLLVMVLNRI